MTDRFRLEDLPSFKCSYERLKVYGQYFQERLQQEHPKRKFIGLSPDFAEYVIGEEKGVPRGGLGRLLFGETQNKLKILVSLYHGDPRDSDSHVTVFDASLKDSTGKITRELDEKSGEYYGSNISYTISEVLRDLK